MLQTTIDDKVITIYPATTGSLSIEEPGTENPSTGESGSDNPVFDESESGNPAAKDFPIVYSNDYFESGQQVLPRCAEMGCPPFNLVTISKIDWDRSMSPWPSKPVVAKDDDFTGESPAYLAWLLDDVVPSVNASLGAVNPTSYIAGYSMAGLFALWALYQTDYFAGAASVSGSVWFPGFHEFALTHDLVGGRHGIYLSLGDRETKGGNPVLSTTDSVYQDLRSHYEALCIPTTFESNPGNHFKDADLRVAKGISWLLKNAMHWERSIHTPA